jgi:hypothetical protein
MSSIDTTELKINMPSENALTYATASVAYGTALLAQVSANPAVESLGIGAAIVGTVALSIRTAGEVAKAWIAFKDAALHATELKADIARLEAAFDANRKLARKGVCPYDDDGQATCGVRKPLGLPDPPSH